MNQDKIKRYIFLLLGLLFLVICIKEAFGNGDFKVYLEAARLLKSGKSPYNVWIFVSENDYCLYYYSPLWAMILTPFAELPNFIPNIIWLSANLFFLYRIWELLICYVNLNSISKKQLIWLLIFCFLMTIRFILLNLGMIQMTIFILWGSLESIRLIENKKVIWGGILLALIINIKILAIVIIPYLFYRKYFKGLSYVLAFSLIFLLLPAFYTGWTENLVLLSEWWNMINPTNPEHMMESDLGPHSLTAWIPTLLVESTGAIPMKRNLLNLNENTAILVLNIIRLFLIVLSLYFLNWPPFTKAKSKLYELRELAYIFLLIPLIFPHQQKYAFFLILPAIFYLFYFIMSNFPIGKHVTKSSRLYFIIGLICCSFILMTLTTDGIIGRVLNNISQHFKTITWGALLLILALVLAKPSFTKK